MAKNHQEQADVSFKATQSTALAILVATHSMLAKADLIESIERVKPSIVVVGVYNKTSSPQFQMRGTGFIVTPGNIIATNAHVAPETLDSATRIAILSPAESRESSQLRIANVIARDRDHDLALMAFDGPSLPAVSISDSNLIREGQPIAFTGFPIGGALGFSPVTHRGTISSITPIAIPSGNSNQLNEKLINQLKRGTFKIFQLDATAYPGNSGSPVFDTETGEVIGVINMVFIKGVKESVLTQPSGISYAIPSAYLNELIRSVSKKK